MEITVKGSEWVMGRRRINTPYREFYAGRKLNRAIEQCDNVLDLQNLWRDYIRVARAERKARLLNNKDIIRGCELFIANIRASINGDSELLDIVLLKSLQADIELEKGKLSRKMIGGNITSKKKAQSKKYSKWYELNYHGFSVNYMYTNKNGKLSRSDAYNRWIDSFPYDETPDEFELLEQGVDIEKPLGIELEFIAKAEFDVDNFSKSFIDTIFGDVDDNIVHETVCRRIGTCDWYHEGMIRVRFYNV